MVSMLGDGTPATSTMYACAAVFRRSIESHGLYSSAGGLTTATTKECNERVHRMMSGDLL